MQADRWPFITTKSKVLEFAGFEIRQPFRISQSLELDRAPRKWRKGPIGHNIEVGSTIPIPRGCLAISIHSHRDKVTTG